MTIPPIYILQFKQSNYQISNTPNPIFDYLQNKNDAKVQLHT